MIGVDGGLISRLHLRAVTSSSLILVVHSLLGDVAIVLVSSGLVILVFSMRDTGRHKLLHLLHFLDLSTILFLVIRYLHTKQFRPR